MSLQEYFISKLNVSIEEAEKIVQVIHEYKKEYGHNHHGRKENETKKEMIQNGICQGCMNQCPVTELKCGRGRSFFDNVNH